MGYSKIFYGFIFLFDLRFAGFDVLPNFIGYILIYQGLTLLKDKNKFFIEAKGLAFPMIFISVLSLYQSPIPINEVYGSSFSLWSILLGLITVLFNLLMVFYLCNGIKSEVRQVEFLNLESEIDTVWHLYLASNLLVASCFIFTSLLPLLFIISFIVSLIAYILMLSLLNTASKRLK
ncbi:hypothetical protein [Fusibacter sp. 3D3]|uniref:hypothetical protein n=1 Tax=Fusibacter sp. 3D3 TaxID=1048380 RepID=UPI0008534DC2|nr:hypothetical protein [Fusibacter sp. 3D3]GAU80026.1 hypothetical protein F3D3_4692 [Fusibacter sp. 3D3]